MKKPSLGMKLVNAQYLVLDLATREYNIRTKDGQMR